MSNEMRLNATVDKMWCACPVLRDAMRMHIETRRAAGASVEVSMQVLADLNAFEKAWDAANLPQAAPVESVDCTPSWMAGHPIEMD
jgi:hypothetical protein